MNKRFGLVIALLIVTACQDRPDIKKIGEVDSTGTPRVAVSGGAVSGVLDVDEALKSKLRPTDVLYVFARLGDSGPPVAVKRFAAGEFTFPLLYQLSASNMMIQQPGVVFAGEMKIFARISRSGDAIGAPGDLEGFYPGGMVIPPAEGIDFRIATERM